MQKLSKDLSKIEKVWKTSLKHSEFGFIEYIVYKKLFNKFLDRHIEKNWIIETLLLENKIKLLKKCKTLVMVGCGMYPYSMIDNYKKMPSIKQIGIDYDDRCVKIANMLASKCNMSDKFSIVHFNGLDFDYSNLLDEDLVFISCDVVGIDEIYSKIIETSKAHVFICAPGKNAWYNNYFSK